MKKVLSTLLVALAISYSSFGQLSIDTVILGERMIKDILNDFENTGNRLMQKAQTTDNNVATQFGNEILVASQNVNHYFGQKNEKAFSNLKIGEQKIFVEINKIIDQFDSADQTVTTVSEMTNLDLTEFTKRISALPKTEYYIRFISGTTIIDSEEPYNLSITGLGFGLSDSRKKYNTVVYINETPLPSSAIDLTLRKQMQLNIPNDLIKPFFKDNQIAYVPIKIISKITTPGGAFDLNTKTGNYETKFNLVLMPAIAGEINISELITYKVLDDRTFTQLISRSFQGCKTKQSCEMAETWHCTAYQKIIGVRYQCGGQCELAYKKRSTTPGDNYAPDFDILNDGKAVAVYRHLDVENRTTINYFVDYKNYKTDSQTVKNSTVKLKYGEQFDVLLNADNPDRNYSITGKLTTGQIINYNSNTILSCEYLKILGSDKSGDKRKISFRLIAL
jgi:hypothetical protein